MANDLMQDCIFNDMLVTEGYRVDFLVGTTYSLDLDTFLSVPFSIGLLEEPDEILKHSDSYIYTAIKMAVDRIAIFCNFSDIKIPSTSRKFWFPLLENAVFGVNATSHKGEIYNFHPKVWVMKESQIDGNLEQIKVMVMSRNLTDDNSLDVVCELTGKIGAKVVSKNKHKPLTDFLTYLSRKAGSKRAAIENLIEDVARVRSFDLDGSPFDDYDFFPMGFHLNGYSDGFSVHQCDYKGKDVLDEICSTRELFVMSPFLDEMVVSEFSGIPQKTLITRETSLTEELVEAFGRDNIYIVKPQLLDNEERIAMDIHAKVYYTTDRHGRHYLWLGSTNATNNGFRKNVEFLLRLRFKLHYSSYSSFRQEFINDEKDCKFMPMISVPEMSSETSVSYSETLRLRQAISSLKAVDITPSEDKPGYYDVRMQTRSEDREVFIAPLLWKQEFLPLISDIVFESVPLQCLSQFFHIRYHELETVIKLDTRGLPVKDRDDALSRHVMKPADFMDCVSLFLADNRLGYALENQRKALDQHEKLSDISSGYNDMPLYENLLKTAYSRPDLFDDLGRYAQGMPEGIVPTDFLELYNAISKAIKPYRQ